MNVNYEEAESMFHYIEKGALPQFWFAFNKKCISMLRADI